MVDIHQVVTHIENYYFYVLSRIFNVLLCKRFVLTIIHIYK